MCGGGGGGSMVAIQLISDVRRDRIEILCRKSFFRPPPLCSLCFFFSSSENKALREQYERRRTGERLYGTERQETTSSSPNHPNLAHRCDARNQNLKNKIKSKLGSILKVERLLIESWFSMIYHGGEINKKGPIPVLKIRYNSVQIRLGLKNNSDPN